MIYRVASVLAVLVVVLLTNTAGAVTCTINGTAKIRSGDRYYCDTDYHSSCSGWYVVDLDDHDEPMQWQLIVVKDGATELARTTTGSDGTWSATFSRSWSKCEGNQVTIYDWFRRIHESDQDELEDHEAYRSRFRVTDFSDVTLGGSDLITLDGPTKTYSWTYQANAAVSWHYASAYFTAAEAITRIKSWTTNLSTEFESISTENESLKVRIEEGESQANANFDPSAWAVEFDYDNHYLSGGTIRHEIGHAAHYAAHHRAQSDACLDYDYNSDSGHDPESCEFGYAATKEGVADFIATRTATSHDTNAWFCDCFSDADQEACSEESSDFSVSTNSYFCPGSLGWVAGLGDDYATTTSHCVDPWGSCAPADGWQVETQVARFLWDLIDAHGETSAEDTNRTITTLMQDFEGVECDGSGDTENHECNEPNSNPGYCEGQRNLYNAWDISYWVPGDQTYEREINCVDDAPDTL